MMMGGKFHIWWPAKQRKMKERKMQVLGRKDLDVLKSQSINARKFLQPALPPLLKSVLRLRANADNGPTGLKPAEVSAACVEFGDGIPNESASPAGGAMDQPVDSEGPVAMLRRVLELKEGADSTEGLHPNMIDGT
ncbi:hypothetical protein FRC12_017206 [Ceratobasidium sp. 428]|nr:hypothetical protein FRC12_017206 [Ceratobasidium sp. 428]